MRAIHMLETLADYDDELMEQLLEEREPPRDQVFDDLVKEMREGLICPVLIGAAEHGGGVGRLLKAIRHESPDIADTRARLDIAAGGDAVVQVMKTVHSTHGGKMSIARVLAGSIGDGAELNGPDGSVGRVSGVFRIVGQHSTKREAAEVGETVGLGKLDGAQTGMTLGDRQGGAGAGGQAGRRRSRCSAPRSPRPSARTTSSCRRR